MKTFVPDTFLVRRKGDTITQAELAPLVGCGPLDARYSLRLCQIAEMLMLRKRRAGEPCTVAQVKGDLKLLTDAEASRYNAACSDQAVRRLRTSNRRQSEVNVANLTDSQRDQHDRRLVVSGARVAMTLGATINRMVKVAAHQRVLSVATTYRQGKG